MQNRKIKISYRKLGRELAYGQASGNSIELDPRLKGVKHLEILNHEIIHILFPELSEEETINASIRLTKTLWSEGYRRIDNNDKDKLQDGDLINNK